MKYMYNPIAEHLDLIEAGSVEKKSIELNVSSGDSVVFNTSSDIRIIQILKREDISEDTLSLYLFAPDEFYHDNSFVVLDGEVSLKKLDIFDMEKPSFYFAKQIDVNPYKDLIAIDVEV